MTDGETMARYKHWGFMGGRRFTLTVVFLFLTAALLVGHYISQEIFRDLALATVAVYIAAAGVQKFGEQKVKVAQIKADAEVEAADGNL